MVTQEDITTDFMNKNEPKVTFKLPDGSEVLMNKEVLIENSDVFKAMLEEEEIAEGSKMEIMIEDLTFHGIKTMPSDFKLFLSAMCGKNFGEDEFDIPTLIKGYFIALKYHVEKVKKSADDEILRQLSLLDITDERDLELIDIIKTSGEPGSKERFARYIMTSKNPYQSLSSNMVEFLFEVYKRIITEQDSIIRQIREKLLRYFSEIESSNNVSNSFSKMAVLNYMYPQEPKVTFKFSDGSEIMVMRKILIENSDVFKSMLEEEEFAEGSKMEIMIEDESTFTGSDTMISDFKIFISEMCDIRSCFRIPTMINVYAIAHKYQVEKVKSEMLFMIQSEVQCNEDFHADYPLPLELLLRFSSTYELAMDFSQIGAMVRYGELEVHFQVYDIAHKYQVEEIKKTVFRYLKQKIEREKIIEPKDFQLLLKFISTYKLFGLRKFNLDITKDNYLDFLRVIKKYDNARCSRAPSFIACVRARKQLARFMIDNKIPSDSFPANLRKQLLKIKAVIKRKKLRR